MSNFIGYSLHCIQRSYQCHCFMLRTRCLSNYSIRMRIYSISQIEIEHWLSIVFDRSEQRRQQLQKQDCNWFIDRCIRRSYIVSVKDEGKSHESHRALFVLSDSNGKKKKISLFLFFLSSAIDDTLEGHQPLSFLFLTKNKKTYHAHWSKWHRHTYLTDSFDESDTDQHITRTRAHVESIDNGNIRLLVVDKEHEQAKALLRLITRLVKIMRWEALNRTMTFISRQHHVIDSCLDTATSVVVHSI
jgi:hypothetical protein